MKKNSFLIIVVCCILAGISYSEDKSERDDIFKLGTTPFVDSHDLNIFFSIGQNYGSPGLTVANGTLPDHSKDVLFEDFRVGVSFNSKVQLILKFTKNYLSVLSSPTPDAPSTIKATSFCLKWKFRESNNWFPDLSLKFEGRHINYFDRDLHFPLSFSLGSNKKYYQYFASVDFYMAYFVPFPNRYSTGVAITPMKYFRIFGEYMKEPRSGGGSPDVHVLRYGIGFWATKYLSIDVSCFYFDFPFNEVIPFRDELDPDDPEKDEYRLFSWSINFHLR